MSNTRKRHPHPYIPELADALRRETVTRREFLRTATLLGLSAGTAYAMAAEITGRPWSGQAQAATGTGGTLSCAMRVQEISDPATFDWSPKSNISRHFIEYLTVTGSDNVTRPYLAEGWEVSEDLKTWTFKLRKNVTWSNGDAFNADDVVFNLERWLDPATGSSNIGLFSAMVTQDGEKKSMTPGAVEKVDEHTVRLHLNRPELSIPENFYNYPTGIVHRRFEEDGGDLSKAPVGTGPYELAEITIGERAVLRKRKEPYWGGAVSLDEIRYIDLGDDPAAALGALASGQVNMLHELNIEQLDTVQAMPNVQLLDAVTAQTAVARMQTDKPPFDNKLVRQAMQACVDHAKVLQLAYRGRGAAGEDHHVAPIHPEYFALPQRKPDIEKAKALLAEAGYPNGLEVSVDVNNDAPWESAAVQSMIEMWRPAGLRVKLNIMPGAQYWDNWTKTPFGFTRWNHRPLGVMVLNLAYRSGVPWNESHYNNPAFDKALDEAGATVDVAERRNKMERVQSILQDDAPIVQPLWRSVFTAAHKSVRNLEAHPTLYHQFDKVSVET